MGKNDFINNAFKETDDLMKRFLGTVGESYKDMQKPEDPKQRQARTREEALEKLIRGLQQWQCLRLLKVLEDYWVIKYPVILPKDGWQQKEN